MSDLLEILTDIEARETADPTRVHSVLPDFSVACGINFMASREPYVLGTRNWGTGQVVSCPSCISRFGGIDGLRDRITAAQRKQAA